MAVAWNEFIWQKTNKKHFCVPSGRIGYDLYGDYFILCALPTVTEPDIFWRELVEYVKNQKKILCGYYLTQNEAQRVGLKNHSNFKLKQLGVRRGFENKSLNLDGGEFEEVRRSLNKGHERGLEFKVLSEADKNQEILNIKNLYKTWKQEKGPLDLEFFISPIKLWSGSDKEKWVGVYKDRELVAFVSLIPVGAFSYYVDQMIFSKQQAKWSMNFLFAKLIEQLPVGGSIDFGLCPLANIKDNFLLKKASQATEYLPLAYNFNGLYEFKRKFTNVEEPCYALLQNHHSSLKQYKAMLEVSVNRLRYLVSF